MKLETRPRQLKIDDTLQEEAGSWSESGALFALPTNPAFRMILATFLAAGMGCLHPRLRLMARQMGKLGPRPKAELGGKDHAQELLAGLRIRRPL